MPKPGPAVVYRYFNGAGLVLYVGVSQDFSKRWATHSKQQVWWDQVARCTVDFYASWPEATEVEDIAIATERPVYNLAGSPVAVLHVAELTRLLEGGQVPRDNASLTEMLWGLAAAMAQHLNPAQT